MKNLCLEKTNGKGETEHIHKQARGKESKQSKNRQGRWRAGRERRLRGGRQLSSQGGQGGEERCLENTQKRERCPRNVVLSRVGDGHPLPGTRGLPCLRVPSGRAAPEPAAPRPLVQEQAFPQKDCSPCSN